VRRLALGSISLAVVAVLVALVVVGQEAPVSRPDGAPPATDGAAPATAAADPRAAGPGAADPAAEPAAGAGSGASADESYACLQPDLPIAREPGCAAGRPYPACRWQLPEARDAQGIYRVWRNTTPEHRWARPGLVSLLLATAREYAARWPDEERMVIGDLDAAGPRHQTHDRGVDVDMYLERSMIAANIGGGRYPDNYAGRPENEVRQMRARVLDLAKILATCSGGRLRIYYNDPELVPVFVAWFAERGLRSDVGPAMMMHNPLHRFHFHMTVAEDLAPLPLAR